MADTSTSSSSSGRAVVYKKYDPALRNKRISQLSVGSSNDGSMTGSGTSAAPPTRVLGSKAAAAAAGSSGSASYRGSSSSNGEHDAAVNGGNNDYFATMHSESTSSSISTRLRDRDPATPNRLIGPGSTSGSSGASSLVHTPNSVNGPPSLLSANSNSSTGSYSGASTNSDASYSPLRSSAASTIQPEQKTPTSVMIPLPRAQSAMATLQGPGRSSPSSSQQQYRAFIPPSAYVSSASSTASSPGPSNNFVPAASPGKMVPNVANHISSAFARGLNGVNGVVNGSTSVRIPQSASNVANAVWNRLPVGVQNLKNDLVWDGREASSSASPEARDSYLATMNGFGHIRRPSNEEYAFGQSAIKSASPPPPGTRSLSMGAVFLDSERERDTRPGSSASQSSARGTPASPGGGFFSSAGQSSTFDVNHPNSIPISAQLRLDYANQQLQQVGRQPELGGRIQSVIQMAPTAIQKAKAPYKAGYQPKGAIRNRTEEFMSLRNGKTGAGRRNSKELDGSGISLHSLEDERLLRRLDKIIELHFPSPGAESVQSGRAGMPRSTSISSIASDSTVSLSPQRLASGMRRTSDMFGRAMKGVTRITGGNETRSGDQLIVKWQEDSEATHCPICHAPFNVITRKHHCRLCGRVVCFLPPNVAAPRHRRAATPSVEHASEPPPPLVPSRSQRCSTFIIYEHLSAPQNGPLGLEPPSLLSEKHARSTSLLSSGILREVDLGDSGGPVNPSLSARERDILETQLETKRAEETKRGVRVCRECLDIVMKRQKKVQPKRVEGWMRLYGLLTDLQGDIEDALPTLSELRSTTPTTTAIVKEFNSSRKQLLQNLASYDLLAKRIRDLAPDPTTPTSPASRLIGPNNQPISSSQDRLQKAIYSRAMLFLGEKMAVIKGMGGLAVDLPPLPPVSQGPGVIAGDESQRRQSTRSKKEEEERMARLAVLYEQEALVSGYLDDANARRQFEDASALKSSLDDLREEIQALLA